MATTLYLLNSAADAGTLPTSERSALTETTASTYSLLAASTTAGTTAVQSSRATAASTTAQVLLLGEYASPAIAAGVTSITLASFGLAISESNANVNWLSTRLNVYVWRPSTSTIVSQHDVDYTHTEALISTTSGAWITGAPNAGLACQAGDRVVVEVFARLTAGMATAYSVGLRFGGSDTTWTAGVTSASPASGIQFSENGIFGAPPITGSSIKVLDAITGAAAGTVAASGGGPSKTLRRTNGGTEGAAGDITATAAGLDKAALTYSAWVVIGPGPESSQGYSSLIFLKGAGANTMSWVGIRSGTSIITYAGSESAAITSVVPGDVLHIAVVHTGTTFVAHITKNGGATISTPARAFIDDTPARFHALSFGTVNPTSSSINLPRVWTASLTLAELASERTSYSPVRTTNLWSAATFANKTSGLLDTSGNNINWTVNEPIEVGSDNSIVQAPGGTVTPITGTSSLTLAAITSGGGGGSVVVDIAGAVKQYWPSGTSFAVTKPTGLAAGDYWFVFTAMDSGNLTSVVPPAGWSLLTTAAVGRVDGGTLHAHYKIATGSEAATETFTSVGRPAALISLRVTGAGAIHKFSAQELNTGAITQFPTGGSLTTTTACELLWVAAADFLSQTVVPTWVQPTSYNSFTTHSTGDWNSLAIAKKTQAVAGTESATGAQVSTTDTIGGALSFLVAFSPAEAPATLRRAISLIGGVRRQLTSSELGTGIKPLVLLGGILKLRATTEGTPVVFVSGKYKTLSANETLEI